MAFAGHVGVSINLDMLTIDPVAADWGDYKIRPEQVSVQRDELTLKALFAEENGAVIRVPAAQRDSVMPYRKCVVEGKCGSVRVEIGGHRLIKKKQNILV